MKALVCGGRGFNDFEAVNYFLGSFPEITMVIQGGAKGADEMAKVWAYQNGIHCAEVPAMWKHHGKRAGPLRNKAMLALCPDMVIAFPGGTGTAGMIKLALEAGLPVWEP